MDGLSSQVLQMIPETAKGRIHGKEIAQQAGISPEKVRKVINKARTSGIPVCADGRGYYIASDVHDVEKTIQAMSGRVDKMVQAINGLEAWRKRQMQ